MSLISIDIQCGVCDLIFDDLVQRPAAEYGLPTYVCRDCGGEAFRIPSPLKPLRASYHDGYRRGGAYEDLKQAAKLKVERANLPRDQRAAIDSEISKVQRSAGRGTTKKDKSNDR